MLKSPANTQFLSGGGEMGNLIRQKDWSKTPVGSPEDWPQSLKTTISIILNSKFPMFLWWGPELICFYNDAYRPSLGQNGKHPVILGMKAEDAWPEIWPTIKPLINHVLEKGEPTWSEDQLIPIFRNGRLEDAYWTFSYSPVKDESDLPAGVLVTCYESTEKINILQGIKEREDQLSFTVNAAELATWDLNPITNKFSGNSRLKEWLGVFSEEEMILSVALDRIIKEDRQRVSDAMAAAIQGKMDGNFEVIYTLVNPQSGVKRNVLAKGKAVFNDDKIAYRFSGILQDITEQIVAFKQAEESEQRFKNLVIQSPIAMAILRGKDLVIELANTVMLEKLWRKKEKDVIGKRLIEAFPELREQKYLALLTKVYETGERIRENDSVAYVSGDDGWKQFYVDYEYVALREGDGEISGVLVTVNDVTEKVEARNKIEENEERLNIVIDASELGTWEIDLKSKIVITSPRYLEIFGYPANVQPPHEQLLTHIHPEDLGIRAEGFESALKTGKLQYESRIISIDGEVRWIEARGKVFYDGHQKPYRMLGTIRDITKEKQREQGLRESEQKFRLLADSMPQLIWTSDADGNVNYYNKSIIDFTGQPLEKLYNDGWIQIVHPDDRQENIKKWMASIASGQDYIMEHRFLRHDGEYRWQLSRAVPQRDELGNIHMWVGTSTDIQDQKEFTNELEKQVVERTQELELKNEELRKMNLELKSFAYVSSHDLQEPLRKIHTFAARIMEKEEQNLSDRAKDYFQRMQHAADRMQTLIEDLLTYSRTNTNDRKFVKTDLYEILTEVLHDMNHRIEEKDATFNIDLQCPAEVIPFQFRQLLQNLLGNSLKFSKPGRKPEITITSKLAHQDNVTPGLLSPRIKYCHITISDNGIGFDPTQHERIFEVFQRLHGKFEYEGTGIGLAIVKKIVENHHGVIIAKGMPDKGATFEIYLPYQAQS